MIQIGGQAIEGHGMFTVALSGGSSARSLYTLLVTGEFERPIDWSRVHLFWGDERCVPPDDPRSNYRMARESLLDGVPIPAANVHRIHGEEDPKAAAAEYEQELRTFFGNCGEGGRLFSDSIWFSSECGRKGTRLHSSQVCRQ